MVITLVVECSSFCFLDLAGPGDIDGFPNFFIVNVSMFGITVLFSFSSSNGITMKFFGVRSAFAMIKLHYMYFDL